MAAGASPLKIADVMTIASNAQNGLPNAADIRAQVERMIKSDVFANSPQLSAFLLFVVEALLRGRSERLKGYTIGVEVLRRDTSFDPQMDPIVRVEATRLRRAIERRPHLGGGWRTVVSLRPDRHCVIPDRQGCRPCRAGHSDAICR